MYKLLLLCLAMFSSYGTYAQTTPIIEWQRSLGGSAAEFARDILSTPDGGSLMVSSSQSNNGDSSGNHGFTDIWVVKQDSDGGIEWQRMYGGSGSDNPASVAAVAGGGYVIVGTTTSNDGDAEGLGHGLEDIWVIRVDPVGTLIWQRKYGSSLNDEGIDIHETSDGGLLLVAAGGTNDGDISEDLGSFDYWLVKLDSSGQILWQNTFGGSSLDIPYALSLTADGGCILAGYTWSDDGDVTGYHGGNGDGWVVKVDSVGQLQWQKALGGSSDDLILSVVQTEDGGYAVAGYTESSDGDVTGYHGNIDAWVVKLDPGGDLVWQKTLGGSGVDQGTDIVSDGDGGFYVAGATHSTDGDISYSHGNFEGWLLKLDSVGDLVWEKTMGGSDDDDLIAVRKTTDGNFIVAGDSKSTDGDVSGNHGDQDVWVVKLGPDPSGISELRAGPTVSVFPNPTAHFVSIQCELKATGKVRLEVWNASGQLLMTPIQESTSPGVHSWNFDASVLAAGVYQLRFVTDEGSATRSLVKVE